MIMRGRKLQVHAAQFRFVGFVFNTQIRQRDLSVNDSEPVLPGYFGLTAGVFQWRQALGLGQRGIDLFLKFVIQDDPANASARALDLLFFGLEHSVNGRVMADLLRLDEPAVDGLAGSLLPVLFQEFFSLLCQNDNGEFLASRTRPNATELKQALVAKQAKVVLHNAKLALVAIAGQVPRSYRAEPPYIPQDFLLGGAETIEVAAQTKHFVFARKWNFSARRAHAHIVRARLLWLTLQCVAFDMAVHALFLQTAR